jgi:2,3,4,5-tetrahydropyridine-2,6-dicarboxylate N-succinyltransferase
MSNLQIQVAPYELQNEIHRLYQLGTTAKSDRNAHLAFEQLRDGLERGEIRAAQPTEEGKWRTNEWVKEGILLGFRLGELVESSAGDLTFLDKSTLPPRHFSHADNVRMVPGGSSARRGSYIAPGVVCMPPMFINAGAYVGEGTMIDSHALVGSCAQIGKRVHLSAAAQIGGVLEPINASPVVVEDDVLVGGNCGIYEGTIVRKRAVLAPGVILSRGTPVYDIVRGEVYRATAEQPLEIPEGAVVVAGSRAIHKGKAEEWGLSLYTPVIVKYRDEKTDAAVALEEALR